jgi:uncharacterized protein YqjF (DUF2071 family)
MPRRPFLTADWRHLLVLNFEVDPVLIAARIPPGTELDLEDGRCLLSLVAFRFERTRVCGLPIPFHTTFPEVNLRFYVVRHTESGPRRGVVFLRELVNRPAVSLIARWRYNESYRTTPMRSRLDLCDGRVGPSGRVRYEWKSPGRWNRASAVRCGPWRSVHDDPHAAFIAEHYYGYGVGHDGGPLEYHVAHPPWQWCRVQQVKFDCDVAAVYGERFVEALSRPPISAFLLDGSPVRVERPVQFEPQANSMHDRASRSLAGA